MTSIKYINENITSDIEAAHQAFVSNYDNINDNFEKDLLKAIFNIKLNKTFDINTNWIQQYLDEPDYQKSQKILNENYLGSTNDSIPNTRLLLIIKNNKYN